MDLEDTMASLKLNDGLKTEQNSQESEQTDRELLPSEALRRSARLKSRVTYTEKRRVLTKPVKIPKDTSIKDIESYYLDKRIKRLSPSLETIDEDKEEMVGTRRAPRAINFTAAFKSARIKKRRMKAKSVSAHQRVNNKQKIPLKYLLEKLAEIDE